VTAAHPLVLSVAKALVAVVVALPLQVVTVIWILGEYSHTLYIFCCSC
jgi:hypothetical protein